MFRALQMCEKHANKKINIYVENLVKQISTLANCRLVIASLIRSDMKVLKHNVFVHINLHLIAPNTLQ